MARKVYSALKKLNLRFFLPGAGYIKKEGRCPLFLLSCKLNSLLDLCSLAEAVTQVVQLCTTNLALTDSLDHCNVGRMQGENLLAADAVGNTTNGDGLSDTAALTSDDGAFENLDTLTRAFLDAHMNTNGVADLCFGQLFLHVLAVQCLN